MRKPLAVLAALGMTVSLATVTLPAKADTPCTINNYSPHSVVVGLSPKVVTFNISTSGCSSSPLWSVDGEDFYVYTDSPQEVFDPYFNSETKPQDVVVEAYNEDIDSRSRVFANSFTLKRNAGWDHVTASPARPRKGARISIKGRLQIADWDNDRYIGFGNRTVAVEFRTRTGTYHQVTTARTGSGGYLTTTVTATRDGYWRLRYGGNAYAGAGVTSGHFVDVR